MTTTQKTTPTRPEIAWGKVQAMIGAAIDADPKYMPAIEKMAEEWGGMGDFAQVLLGQKRFPDLQERRSWEVGGSHPLEEDWRYFAQLCREAAERINPEDYPAFEAGEEEESAGTSFHFPSEEEWKRRSRIGQWHRLRIPPFRGEAIPEGYGPNAWAYAWAHVAADLHDFLQGVVPQWSPLGDYKGWVVAAGLVTAFRYQLIQPPTDWLPFALAYGRWAYGLKWDSGATLEDLLNAIGHGDPTQLTTEELQALACFGWGSNRELGLRRIPLAVPALQDPGMWGHGYLDTLKVTTGSLEEDAVLFRVSTDPVERYSLYAPHRGAWEEDPEDLFGDYRHAFWRAVGREAEDVTVPTYAQCLAHLAKSQEK